MFKWINEFRPWPRRVPAVAALLLAASCTDNSGPESPQLGRFAVVPVFAEAAGIVPVMAGRFVLRRTSDNQLVKDTVLAIAAGADSVDLTFGVPLFSTGETFQLTIALVGTAGDTVFRAGPITVTPSLSGAPPAVSVPLTYTGTGADAAQVAVLSPDTSVFFGEAVSLQAVALDSSGQPIPNTPIEWRSLDTARVRVPAADTGRVVGNVQRGIARIVARLLTDQADTVLVTAQPVPNAVTADAGNGQVAAPGAALPLPLVARVLAADGLGVEGEWVRFTVTAGGGTLTGGTAVDSARTATDGRAATLLTLGAAGAQVVEATTARLPGATAVFTATAVSAGGTQVAWINGAGGNWSVGANWSTGAAPAPEDTVLITLAGTYTVTLDVSAAVGGLTVGGATGTQTLAVAGQGLSVNGPTDISAAGALSLESGTFSGPLGTITNGGILLVSSSTVNDAIVNAGTLQLRGVTAMNGPVTNLTTGVLAVEATGVPGNAVVTVSGDVTNAGTLMLTHAGGGGGQSATLTVNGTLVNEAGGLLESVPGVGGGPRTLTAVLDNRGALTVDQALLLNATSAAHQNSGAILVGGAPLTIAQSGVGAGLTSSGTITVSTAQALTISGGSFLTDGSTLDGDGALTLTNVTWDIGAGYVVDLLTVTHTGGTITGAGPLTNQGSGATLANVTVDVPLDNVGMLGLRGTTAVNGALSNLPDASLAIEATGVPGNAVVTVANGFVNAGALVLTHAGGGGGQSATLVVSNGTLLNDPAGTISSIAGIGGGGRTLTAVLDNQGTLIVDQALTLNAVSAAHSNAGTVLVQGANLTLTQSGTNPSLTSSGTITVSTAQALTISGGSFLTDGSTLDGDGALTLTNATWDIGAGYVVDLLTVTHTGGTITGAGPLTNQGSGATLANMTVDVPLDNVGILALRGTIAVNGALANLTNASLSIEATGAPGNAVVTVANGFVNAGALVLTHAGGGGGQSATLVVSSGTLVNDAGGTLSVVPGVGGGPRGLTASLDNRSVVLFEQATTWTNGAAPSVNSGFLSATAALTLVQDAAEAFTNAGSLSVGGGTSVTVTGGTFSQTQGGALFGDGTLDIAGTTVAGIDGSILPGTSPGVLSVTGNLPLTPTSFLFFELDGPTVGTGFDQLAVSGTVALDGQVSAVLNYPAAVGDSFPVLTFTGRTGAPSALAPVAFQNGVVLDTVGTSSSLSFVARSQILFAGFDGGLGGMFRANPDGSGFFNVTTEGPPNSSVSYPRWAPDRTRLTYSANNAPPPFLLHVTSWDGAEISHPVNDTNTTRPRFSLNAGTGQLHLAFVCGDQFFALSVDVCTVADVSGPIPTLEGVGDGGGKVFVTDAIDPALGGTGAFAWNPTNPDQLAVVRDTLFPRPFGGATPASQIWLVNFDGSGRAALTPGVIIVTDGGTGGLDTLQVEFMDWSPDGSFIAFSAIDQQFNAALYRVEAATGVITQLTTPTTLEDDEQPVISPDNATILFVRNDFALESSNWNLWTISATGGVPAQLTSEFPSVFFGTGGITYDWAPDGKEIVTVGSDGTNTAIYVIDASTTNPNNYLSARRLVGRLPASDVQPSWRP